MRRSNDHVSLIDRLFAAIDSRDTDAFLCCLHPAAEFRFGSAPVLHGHAAIRDAVEGFFASIAGLSHSVERSIEAAGTIVCAGNVTYRRRDDTEVTLPFANIFDFDGELIRGYRIYIDIAPLHAGG